MKIYKIRSKGKDGRPYTVTEFSSCLVVSFLLAGLFFLLMALMPLYLNKGWSMAWGLYGVLGMLLIGFPAFSFVIDIRKDENWLETERRRLSKDRKVLWISVFAFVLTPLYATTFILGEYAWSHHRFESAIALYQSTGKAIHWDKAEQALEEGWMMAAKLKRHHVIDDLEAAFKTASKKAVQLDYSAPSVETMYRIVSEYRSYANPHQFFKCFDGCPYVERADQLWKIFHEAQLARNRSYNSALLVRGGSKELMELWYKRCFQDGQRCSFDNAEFYYKLSVGAAYLGLPWHKQVLRKAVDQLRVHGYSQAARAIEKDYQYYMEHRVYWPNISFGSDWKIPKEFRSL